MALNLNVSHPTIIAVDTFECPIKWTISLRPFKTAELYCFCAPIIWLMLNYGPIQHIWKARQTYAPANTFTKYFKWNLWNNYWQVIVSNLWLQFAGFELILTVDNFSQYTIRKPNEASSDSRHLWTNLAPNILSIQIYAE